MIRYLIDGGKPKSKSSLLLLFKAFPSAADIRKTMKIARGTPLTRLTVRITTVRKDALVFDDECFLIQSKHHRRGMPLRVCDSPDRILSVLNQLVSKRSRSLQVPEFGPEHTEKVHSSANSLACWLIHVHAPFAMERWRVALSRLL